MSERLRTRKMAKIQALAQACGYQVFGDYVDRNTPLSFRCVAGHEYSTRPSTFVAGYRCAECAGTKRKSIEGVRKDFEARGFKLISQEYVNTKTPLEVQCPVGHRSTIRYNNFQQGHGCEVCGRHATHENRLNVNKYLKLAELNEVEILNPQDMQNVDSILRTRCAKGHIREVKISSFWIRPYCTECRLPSSNLVPIDQIIKEAKYTLLRSERVEDSRFSIERNIKIYLRCPNGHEYRTSAEAFRSGTRCGRCQSKTRRPAFALTYELVKTAIERDGYRLLSEQYHNAFHPMLLRCPEQHEFQIIWNKWQMGVRCSKCFGTPKKTLAEVAAFGSEFGYKLLSHNYSGKEERLQWRCPEDHEISVSYGSLQQGRRCPRCITNIPESELLGLLAEWKVNYIHRDRQVISPQEIDIYLPEHRLGIEYCGLYWHSNAHKPTNYHMEKSELCERDQIRLLTIFEDEWLENRKFVVAMLRHRIFGEEMPAYQSRSKWSSCFPKNYHDGRNRPEAVFVDRRWFTRKDFLDYEHCTYLPPESYPVFRQRRVRNPESLTIADCGHMLLTKKPQAFPQSTVVLPLGKRVGLFTYLVGDLRVHIQNLNVEYLTDCGWKPGELVFRENELRNQMPIVLSIIRSRLGNSQRIYARKCKVIKVADSPAREFNERHHLMGHSYAKYAGLEYQGRLVSLLGYKKTSEGYTIERFSNILDTTVVGAFSRLTHFMNDSPITSFVDLRYGDGHSLEKLGYQRVTTSQGWCWTDGQNTYNRLKCRANMDERGLSQKEHSREKGWWKIYDAGQAKYVRAVSARP